MALKYVPGLHSHSGGVVLVWHKKSNTLFLQFPNQPLPHYHHHKSLSSTSTTTTTTTTVDISTTVTLCWCQLSPWLLLRLLEQAIVANWRTPQMPRLQNENRIRGRLHMLLMLSLGLASSTALPPLMLPLATNPPPLEPTMAANRVGCLPAILAIFAAAQSLLSPRWTR